MESEDRHNIFVNEKRNTIKSENIQKLLFMKF